MIGNSAFDKCSSLTQVSIPSSVISIGRYAFFECSSLTQISIPPTASFDKAFTFSSFDCIYLIANQFLSNLNQQKKGLILLKTISSMTPEDEIENVLGISSKFLFNENEAIRIISFKLIRNLIYQTSENQISEFDEQITELIKKYSEFLFKFDRVNDEFKKFIQILSDIFLYEASVFSDLMCIVDRITQMINDKKISIEIRISCFSIIDISSSECVILDVNMLFKALQLTIEACQKCRFDDNYLFGESFLQKYALDTQVPIGIFKQNIEKLSESKNLSDQQVALLLIKISIEASSFEDCVNYIDLTLKIGDCGDDTIIKHCLNVFRYFVDNPNESLAIRFDQISKFLLKNIDFDSLNILTKLIKNLHRSPDYFKDIIDSLLLILKSKEKSKATEVLKCINACFSSGLTSLSPFDKPFDPAKKVFEIVSEGMNEFEVPIVLKIFGNLVFYSPELIKNNLDKIMKFCQINMKSSYLLHSSKCIKKIASYLPDSIFPFLPDIAKPMIDIISMIDQNSFENIEDDSISIFMYKIIECLCQIGLGNDEFAKKYENLLWDRFNIVIDVHIVICDISAKFFAKRGFQVIQILSYVLEHLIMVPSHYSYLYHCLETIQQIILFLPKDQMIPISPSEELKTSIQDTLISAGTGIYQNFVISKTIPFIPSKIYRKLFKSLLAFADVFQEYSSDEIEKLMKNISYELMNTSKLSCILFLHFLTKVLMNCRSILNNDNIIDSVVKIVSLNFQSIQKEKYIDTEKLSHILMSFIYILRMKEKSFNIPNENVSSFIKSLIQIDSYNNFDFIAARQTLILNLIMVYELPIDDDVKKIFNEIKFIKNMEVLPLLADCFIYIFKIVGNDILPLLKKFASILFSSEKYVLNIIDKDTLQFYNSLMSSIKQEELIIYTNLNESSIHQIADNMVL